MGGPSLLAVPAGEWQHDEVTEDAAVSGRFTDALLRMSGVVLSRESVDTAVELVTTLAAATLSSTIGAGVSLMDQAGKRTTAASDPLVVEADLQQYEFDEGPCLSAARKRTLMRIDDLPGERRWPQWGEAVAELGLRSVLSAPLIAGHDSIDAMKVYSREVSAYGEHAEHLLTLFSQQAAILLANMLSLRDARQLSADLGVALVNRDVIGQAKGFLLARGARDEEAAFNMLISASQRSNTKLHEVARQVMAGATRPPDDSYPV